VTCTPAGDGKTDNLFLPCIFCNHVHTFKVLVMLSLAAGCSAAGASSSCKNNAEKILSFLRFSSFLNSFKK